MILALGPNICIDWSSDSRSTCEFAKLGPKFGPFAADLALVAIFSVLARCPRTPPEWPFNRISIQFGPFAADFALVAIFSHLARCPNKPSRVAFPMGFRPNLAHLLHIWPWWQFLASWPGAPESLQNCLSNGISAHFDSVAPYFALVGAWKPYKTRHFWCSYPNQATCLKSKITL